eukprot:COSAG02_NODE_34165_length_488_cov_1.596401_2_plen_60_part_00
MSIDRDESGTVELEEMLEVLSEDALNVDDPITKVLLLHKGADCNSSMRYYNLASTIESA